MSDLLLDRDVELAALERQLAAIRSGAGRVVAVEGPAGIGKSSLVAAAGRSAAAGGMTIVRARGGPLEQDAVWGVARQLFEPLRARGDWPLLTAGAASLAARALDAGAPEPALAGDAMHAAVHGLMCLTCNLTDRAPVLVVVDDIHWADAASLRWLAQLSRRLEELPLGIVCAVRVGEPPSEPELLAEVLAAAPEPSVRPRPLGPAATQLLVGRRLPTADATFAHACHAVTTGNPFLIEGLLNHVVAEKITPDEATAERLSSFGPDQIARAVERQLARLPAGAVGLARALTVLGRDAPLRHAARLAGLDPRAAARVADSLRAAGLVEGEDRLAFAHPLIAAAVYGALAPGTRAMWHSDAAGLLAAERADPERVALHLLRTDPEARPQTVEALLAAAAVASARGAPESAVAFLRRALAEPPLERATEAAVRLELGLARAVHVQPDAPELLRQAVESATSPAQRTAYALRAARALGLAGHFDHALALSRRGLEHLAADAPPGDCERLEAELICNASLRASTHHEAWERLRKPQVQPTRLTLWRANAALLAMMAGRPAGVVRELLAPVLADGTFDREVDSVIPTAATIAMIVNDDLDVAISRCAALIDVARSRGWLVALAHASFLRAMALVRAGRIREAETDARLAVEFKQANSPAPALLWALHLLVDALTEGDELAAADAVLVAADQLGDPPQDALTAPLLLQSRARLRLAQHRADDAYTDAEAARRRWEEFDVQHPGFASWRVEAATALTALGDLPAARLLAREHLRLAERLGTAAPQAAGLRVLALAGHPAERVDLLERAAALSAAGPAQLEHTRTLVELGGALRRANRRADARLRLRGALDLADRHGMRLLARRAGDELNAAGARPRRAAIIGLDSLTPAEHRVVALAAGGCSNGDIARQLFVTRRTVETHLTHAFHKLEISTRAEITARLSRLDTGQP
jgi:DNA-binding CsgD family transcriptional regulator